jgi:cell wall-associated NlpC family hydrolase
MRRRLRRGVLVAVAIGSTVVLTVPSPAAANDGGVGSWEAAAARLVGISNDPIAVRARVALGAPGTGDHLDVVAALVAERVDGVDADRLAGALASTTATRRTVVLTALAQVGKPYAYGGAGPLVFDCSGLTRFAWRAGNVSLSHYTGLQKLETKPVPVGQLQPGDLVFNLQADGDGHVMLYLGADRAVIDAPATGTVVRVRQWATTTGFGSPLR